MSNRERSSLPSVRTLYEGRKGSQLRPPRALTWILCSVVFCGRVKAEWDCFWPRAGPHAPALPSPQQDTPARPRSAPPHDHHTCLDYISLRSVVLVAENRSCRAEKQFERLNRGTLLPRLLATSVHQQPQSQPLIQNQSRPLQPVPEDSVARAALHRSLGVGEPLHCTGSMTVTDTAPLGQVSPGTGPPLPLQPSPV